MRTTYYVMAAAVENSYDLTPADLNISGGEWVVYDWATQTVIPFSTATPIRLAGQQHASQHLLDGGSVPWSLSIISPVVGGWAVVGDPSKYVTASSKRVSSVINANHDLEITMLGEPKEEITACAYSTSSKVLQCAVDIVKSDGRATITLTDHSHLEMLV